MLLVIINDKQDNKGLKKIITLIVSKARPTHFYCKNSEEQTLDSSLIFVSFLGI